MTLVQNVFCSIVFLTCSLAVAALPEPTLSIKTPAGTRVFTRSELLARQDRIQIKLEKDPTAASITYEAVPIQALFENVKIPANAILQYHCLDGFSAPISPTRLFDSSPTASHAFLAIETPSAPWPNGGPFYLIWTQPQASRIGPEEWPYQLDGFELKPSLRSSFPKIFPQKRFVKTDPVTLGLQGFVKNCFSCHTLNQQGESKMGPDLNIPLSPTEYFSPQVLKKLIRDPQQIRAWPQSRMKGFTPQMLPDSELENIVAYLKYMARHRTND